MGKKKESSKAVISDKAWTFLTHGVLQSVNYTARWPFSEEEGPGNCALRPASYWMPLGEGV